MTGHRSWREIRDEWLDAMTPGQQAEYEAARRLAERMSAREEHAALLRDAAEILQGRGVPGDTCLAATLRCAADAFPWRYGAASPDVDDVMTGLVRTADEIVQNDRKEN